MNKNEAGANELNKTEEIKESSSTSTILKEVIVKANNVKDSHESLVRNSATTSSTVQCHSPVFETMPQTKETTKDVTASKSFESLPPIKATATTTIDHLHHAASAPVFSAPMRANQQQQQKIKSYHDAKQTALWDTNSSTTSGGAILKYGISITCGSPKMLRKTSESSSCGMLPRRVSFPKSDKELVTGYLEPANPWEHVSTVNSVSEIADLYTKSCHKHKTRPLPDILDQLKSTELNKLPRQQMLSLKKVHLQPSDCEALEEILKRVQYKCIDISSCELEECAISALCEMIEYYEAANELNISTNPKGMTHRGWTSCAYMVGRSQELQILNAEGNPISKSSAEHLGIALTTSNLHTVKLEHCGLKGAPLSGLCLKIRHNKNLKELWLAHNDLDCRDAESIADLLKVNHFLEFVDISNNNIGDDGLKHIVEALIVQSKELERRSVFQRTAAIDDDIFSPIDSAPDNEPSNRFVHETVNEEVDGVDVFQDTKNDKNPVRFSENNDNTNIVDETSKNNSGSDVLIPDLDAFSIEMDSVSLEGTALAIDETEAEDDTEDTVKTNTMKDKQQPHIAAGAVGGIGQSMLDKLLTMNSDSSSEEGVSNLSTDTIAACGSDDTSFVSDEIFDLATTTNTTNTCTNTKANSTAISSTTSTAIERATTITLPLSLNAEMELMSFGLQTGSDKHYKQEKREASACDTCSLEANISCECSEEKKLEAINSATLHRYHNNYNNNNTNNNNNNSNTVQNQQIEFKDTMHNLETLKDKTKRTNDENQVTSANVFEVTPEESDCQVPPCTSSAVKSNVLLIQNSSSAVDVNKNTRLAEDYDDTHSTDSAFESASEGDISRTIPEEFTRLSTSLESSRLDEIAKEMAIETATIATESTEYLSEAGITPVVISTPTPNTLPIVKVGTQKSDEIKTKDAEIRFSEPLVLGSDETIDENISDVGVSSDIKSAHEESSLPKVTTDNKPSSCVKRCEDNKPITTPPPPSASPGGVSLNLRRTDSSCNILTQSTRNHSQSSDSLCSDNSLDGSVSSDLNLSTSAAQLNELTKNDTLTRQQRQCELTTDGGNRAPGGLKALAVWNNNLTKKSGLYISDLLADTTSLELLNIGKNCLSNDFVLSIKENLTKNTTLTTLGLQSAHLSAKGIETLASILSFGGNSNLQRIDIRDNKLEVESLTTLADALKSNTTVTQIDIDDEPKRLSVGSDAHLDYVRVVENVRSMCSRNEKTQTQIQAEKTASSVNSTKRRGGYYVGSRKISLTCHSRPLIEHSIAPAVSMTSGANKLEVKRKTGVRLRSPVPSPPTISPSSSPNRSRFQVFRVTEVSPLTSPATNSAPIPALSCSADSQQRDIMPTSTSTLTTSTSLPSMATVTSSTQTIRRHASSPRSRFHVSKIYEDPQVPLAKRSLPPITPPIHLPPTPMLKSAPKDDTLYSNVNCSQGKDICSETENMPINEPDTKVDTIDGNDSTQKARCPIAVFNENDITLTHSSANDILLNSSTSPTDSSDIQSTKDASETDNSTVATIATQQVARKVSWIGNQNPQTAVDKLLTLFQNPATIFQRSSSPENKILSATSESITTISQAIQTARQTQNSPVSGFKHSSPTRSKLGSDSQLNIVLPDTEKTITNEQPKSFLGAASKQLRDFGKQVFWQNITPGNESNICSTDNNVSSTIPTDILQDCDNSAFKMNVKFENNQSSEVRTFDVIRDITEENLASANTKRDDKGDVSAAAQSEDIKIEGDEEKKEEETGTK